MWALNALLPLKSTAYISARLCSPVMLSAVLSLQVWAPNTRRTTFANIEWMDTETWRNGKYFVSESVSAPLSVDSATAFPTWYRALGDLRVISVRGEWSLSYWGPSYIKWLTRHPKICSRLCLGDHTGGVWHQRRQIEEGKCMEMGQLWTSLTDSLREKRRSIHFVDVDLLIS